MTEDADLLEDLKSTETAFVIFSSIMGGMAGYKPFEFVRSFKDADASLVFVRDVDQVWYQGGFRGVDGEFDGALSYLRTLRDRHRRLVLTGYSAGGFASILFGELVGADIVFAIAPQAAVDLDVMRKLRDVRWKALIENINERFPATHTDLRDHVTPEGNARVMIATPGDDPLDRAHLALLRPAFGERNVALLQFDGCSHTTMLQPLKQSRLIPGLPSLLGSDQPVDAACSRLIQYCAALDGVTITALSEVAQP